MSFFEKMFGWRVGKAGAETGPYNHMFSVWHILFVVAAIAFIVFMCIYMKKKTAEKQNKVLLIIAIVLTCLEVLRMIYRTISTVMYSQVEIFNDEGMRIIPYDVAEIISFALCTIMTWFTVITLFINKEKWNHIAYPVMFVCGTLCGGLALLYPDNMLNTCYPFYHIMTMQTLITHTLIIAVPIMLLSLGKFKLLWKEFYIPLVAMLIFAIIARVASVVSVNDFMYMWAGLPFLPATQAWGFPLFVLPMLGIFLAYQGIIYLVYFIVQKVKARKNNLSENLDSSN